MGLWFCRNRPPKYSCLWMETSWLMYHFIIWIMAMALQLFQVPPLTWLIQTASGVAPHDVPGFCISWFGSDYDPRYFPLKSFWRFLFGFFPRRNRSGRDVSFSAALWMKMCRSCWLLNQFYCYMFFKTCIIHKGDLIGLFLRVISYWRYGGLMLDAIFIKLIMVPGP